MVMTLCGHSAKFRPLILREFASCPPPTELTSLLSGWASCLSWRSGVVRLTLPSLASSKSCRRSTLTGDWSLSSRISMAFLTWKGCQSLLITYMATVKLRGLKTGRSSPWLQDDLPRAPSKFSHDTCSKVQRKARAVPKVESVKSKNTGKPTSATLRRSRWKSLTPPRSISWRSRTGPALPFGRLRSSVARRFRWRGRGRRVRRG